MQRRLGFALAIFIKSCNFYFKFFCGEEGDDCVTGDPSIKVTLLFSVKFLQLFYFFCNLSCFYLRSLLVFVFLSFAIFLIKIKKINIEKVKIVMKN